VSFAMLIFNRLLWQWITFNTYLLPEKNQRITFKVTFVANGKILALITPGRPATDNFQHVVRPIEKTKSTAVTF
jgi:hypothetical protein